MRKKTKAKVKHKMIYRSVDLGNQEIVKEGRTAAKIHRVGMRNCTVGDY